jgi:probable HAF family extracellular repeat protein
VLHDLGTLAGTESSAYGINAFGTIVGYAQPAINVDFDGFIYSNGTMTDLNTLLDSSGAGYRVRGGFAINDSGWIAATAVAPNGHEHAVLLTPVPEPSSLVLAVLVIVGLAGQGVNRRA